MVLHSLVQKTEMPPPQQQLSMASPPSAKFKQPLHNFALPDVRWAVKGYKTTRRIPKVYSSAKKESAADVASGGARTKIILRLRRRGSKVDAAADHVSVGVAEDQSKPKTWNLRPRRAVMKPKVNNNNNNITRKVAVKIGGGAAPQGPVPSGKAPAAKNEKKKFSVSLSKEEIEEDFLAMTGSKPPRKPNKRPNSVQKNLNYIFPGSSLGLITADSYKVDDDRSKI